MDSIAEEALNSSAEETVETAKSASESKYEFQASVCADEDDESSGEETYEDAVLASFLDELNAESDEEEAVLPSLESSDPNGDQVEPTVASALTESAEVQSQRVLSIDSLIQRQRT